MVWMNRARVDQDNLASSLKKINVTKSADCPCAHSVDQVLWKCPIYAKERDIFMKEIRRKYKTPTTQDVLSAQNYKNLKIVSKFL